MKKEQLELAVLVDPCELKGSYSGDTSGWYKIRFVTIGDKEEVRNPSSSFMSEPYAGFDDLVFRAYISWSDKFGVFSWETLYDTLYSVDLGKAEAIAKTLKRIAKIETGFVVRPSTFGQYVAMVCHGLGVKRFARLRGRNNGMHNENTYQFLELKSLADVVDRSIEKAREEKFPVQLQEAS